MLFCNPLLQMQELMMVRYNYHCEVLKLQLFTEREGVIGDFILQANESSFQLVMF